MTRQKVIGIFTFEGSLYSFLALILATFYGLPLLAWFAEIGLVVPPADQKMGIPIAETIFPIFGLKLVFGTIFLVLFASTIVSFLPTRKISRLDPILALKGKKQ
jgi:ABC-type lipoprotein release transport system permease subunit